MFNVNAEEENFKEYISHSHNGSMCRKCVSSPFQKINCNEMPWSNEKVSPS